MISTPYITPNWQVPANIHALMTTRLGGVSPTPYNSMNVGAASGDTDENVQKNKAQLTNWLEQQGLRKANTCYLKQVHGTHALNLDDCTIRERMAKGEEPQADACYTTTKGIVCAIRVADCMPVLIAVPRGVAAIHAGWRGLAQGIITKTLTQLLQASKQTAANATIWLGPCIGAEKFEVGADVKEAFESLRPGNQHAFSPHPYQADKWLANLPWLAAEELKRSGVRNIYRDGRCTVTEEALFFSYRRDQKKLGGTGRMIACIWLQQEPA